MTRYSKTVSTEIYGKLERPRRRLVDAVIPAAGAVLLWNLVGVNNVESGVHIEYSLGSSMPWHGWLNRGNPGEVVRWFGVPIYDQWSGLGYRLPTQGSLTSLPIVYIARYFPLNLAISIWWLFCLTLMFIAVHRWIANWRDELSLIRCAFTDLSIIGVMSFYTLWHGWQQYPLQVAGAIICLVSVLDRDLIENPGGAELLVVVINFSFGMTILVLPHYGYAMTYLPTIVVLSFLVVVRRRGIIIRRIIKRPLLMWPILFAILVLLPGLLDIRRELNLQSALPPAFPEYGIFHYTFDVGNFDLKSSSSWLLTGLNVIHTTVFPFVGLIRPETYLELLPGDPRSFFQVAWSHNRTQFGGGLLAVILAIRALFRPKLLQASVIERFVGAVILGSLYVGMFSVAHPFGSSTLRWVLELKMIPGPLLSNGRWQYMDLSAVLTLLLFAWQDHKVLTSRGQSRDYLAAVRALRNVVVTLGVSMFALLLPYRVLETVRLNQGQTRFAPLQLEKTLRSDNEQWISQIAKVQEQLFQNSATSPQRVLIPARETNAQNDILFGLEGYQSWFGLRVHAQLRDIQLSSLASKPKIRSGLTLEHRAKQTQLGHDVWNFVCDSDIRARLDFLSVSWSVLPGDCAIREFSSASRIELPMPPEWSRPSNRKNNTYATEFRLASTEGDFVALRNATFSHWWTRSGTRSGMPCSLLIDDCLADFLPTNSLSQPPLEICSEACVATYHLKGEAPIDSRLLVPLNYDPTLEAVQNGVRLRIDEFQGLVAISSESLGTGTIRISVRPDAIMTLYGVSPLIASLLSCLVVVVNSRSLNPSRSPARVMTVS